MKDLPSDLNGSNNCRKTLVKENDILKVNQQLELPYVQTTQEGMHILQRYEQRQRRLGQLYHSRPISKSDSAE